MRIEPKLLTYRTNLGSPITVAVEQWQAINFCGLLFLWYWPLQGPETCCRIIGPVQCRPLAEPSE
jgi:hypothetical protein